MNMLITIAISLLVLTGIVVWLKARTARPDKYPYTKTPILFTPAERSILGALEQAVGADYKIFGKVRVADVISVKSMRDRSAWRRAFNRINAKHFDFLLCTRDHLSIVGAVELNDRSHESSKRQDRDAFLQEVCKAASLPLIAVQARSAYSLTELREQIYRAVRPSPDARTAAQEDSVPWEIEPEFGSSALAVDSRPGTVAGGLESATPQCPECSAPMVRRRAKRGVNADSEFWGCSTFPSCRGILR